MTNNFLTLCTYTYVCAINWCAKYINRLRVTRILNILESCTYCVSENYWKLLKPLRIIILLNFVEVRTENHEWNLFYLRFVPTFKQQSALSSNYIFSNNFIEVFTTKTPL